MSGFDLKDTERRMRGALTVLKQEFGGLRTGRANMSLLDPIMVNAYGSQMPLNQLATVNVPESRLITVQVWDRSQVGAVERAIRESDLGLNPVVEGQLLRLPIPELNEERRHEIAVEAFLDGRIGFLAIGRLVESTLDRSANLVGLSPDRVDDVLTIDAEARAIALSLLRTFAQPAEAR